MNIMYKDQKYILTFSLFVVLAGTFCHLAIGRGLFLELRAETWLETESRVVNQSAES